MILGSIPGKTFAAANFNHLGQGDTDEKPGQPGGPPPKNQGFY